MTYKVTTVDGDVLELDRDGLDQFFIDAGEGVEDAIEACASLLPGDMRFFGGGAAPEWSIARVS